MAFIVPNLQLIRDKLLRDLKNVLPDADVTPDSDFYVRATSVASAVEGLYEHQKWIVRQIFPDTADAEYLYLHAAVRGLTLKQGVPARGKLQVRGQPGAAIPEGLQAKRADGVMYRTTGAAQMPAAGVIDVPAEATAIGRNGNAVDGMSVTLQAAPVGLDSSAALLSMRGGVEKETDGELLARLLELIRRPPAGGNRYDYRRWAMEVEGVTDAFVYPLRRGLGTVDVAVVSGDGLPSQDTVDRVRLHIDDVRPVTAKGFLVVVPTLRVLPMDIQVALQGTTLEAATAGAKKALQDQFLQLAPGAAWIRSQSEAHISNVSGVRDRRIISPASNVIPTVNADVIEWLRLGAIRMELMA